MSDDDRHERFDRGERRYTAVDLLAGLTFFVGSLLFYSEATQDAGTTLFVIGSSLFVLGPAAKFLRKDRLARAPSPGGGSESRA